MADPHRPLSEGKVAALKLLKLAYHDAKDAGEEPRQFAATKDDLLAAGATRSDLLWLLKLRYVEHVREVTRNGAPQRQFQVADDLVLGPDSCFFLTYLGKVYATDSRLHRRKTAKRDSHEEAKGTSRHGENAIQKRNAALKPEELREDTLRDAQEIPNWNAAEGNLYWRGRVVLHLAPHASAERAVLDEFEATRWQSPIPNPLQRDVISDSTQSRRNAIYNLNQHLRADPPIQFFCLRGDHMGWQVNAADTVNLNERKN